MKITKIIAFVLIFSFLLTFVSCNDSQSGPDNTHESSAPVSESLVDNDPLFREKLSKFEAYKGYFEEDAVDIEVHWISGTKDCYTLEGNVLRFNKITEETVYAISGKLKGNIIIDVGDDYKFDLEMHGFSLICDDTNPVSVLSGDEVSLTAKKGYENFIYDTRPAINPNDIFSNNAAVFSETNLEISGKGSLTVISERNNGIHTKDDLQVKNLTLLVACVDNALKGNDEVELISANACLIASGGDGIKTSNTHISKKGNQKGNVVATGGTYNIYAASEPIDAAHEILIDENTTIVNTFEYKDLDSLT